MEEIQKPLKRIFDGESADALNSFFLTADRGNKNVAYMEIMGNFGHSSLFVMPDYLHRANHFVGLLVLPTPIGITTRKGRRCTLQA